MTIYGKLTRDELAKLEGSSYLFRNGKWYRITELYRTQAGANYQATESVGPNEPTEATVPEEPAVTSATEPPVAIRSWLKKNGTILPRQKGPVFLPKEMRDAYEEEFGREALIVQLNRDSEESRLFYARDGLEVAIPKKFQIARKELERLTDEEIHLLYVETPRKVKAARIEKREEINASVRPIVEGIVLDQRQRRAYREGRNPFENTRAGGVKVVPPVPSEPSGTDKPVPISTDIPTEQTVQTVPNPTSSLN